MRPSKLKDENRFDYRRRQACIRKWTHPVWGNPASRTALALCRNRESSSNVGHKKPPSTRHLPSSIPLTALYSHTYSPQPLVCAQPPSPFQPDLAVLRMAISVNLAARLERLDCLLEGLLRSPCRSSLPDRFGQAGSSITHLYHTPLYHTSEVYQIRRSSTYWRWMPLSFPPQLSVAWSDHPIPFLGIAGGIVTSAPHSPRRHDFSCRCLSSIHTASPTWLLQVDTHPIRSVSTPVARTNCLSARTRGQEGAVSGSILLGWIWSAMTRSSTCYLGSDAGSVSTFTSVDGVPRLKASAASAVA